MSFHGLPCWYELATSNIDGAAAFYGAVLGWNVADSGMPGMTYHIASIGGTMVAGMMPAEPGQPVVWTVYFAVEDADALVHAATDKGAQVVVPPTDIPETGRFAVLLDPQGATFAVLQPLPGGDGGAFDQQSDGHGNWHELITPDPTAALAFYGALFGWTEARAVPMGPDMTYHIIAREGLEIGGSCALPDVAPHWKPYFGTASAKSAVARVTEAGGTVLRGPDEVPGGTFTVQIRDPQGATVALVGGA